MAREQLAGKEVSVASDVFSLGIVLFELLTGKPVFKAGSSAELQRLHQENLTFWYREAPKPLLPMNSISYRMSVTDPPSIAPGMATVWMDPSGSLLRMQIVPPEGDKPAASGREPPRTDWSRLFAASGLRDGELHGADSIWNPPFHSDERQAWTGPFQADKDEELRVEAAS